jgi:hypothetical protein
MAAKKNRRVVVVSDLHSGHLIGLTPPSRHDTPSNDAHPAHKELAATRKTLFSLYHEIIKSLGKIDILICNGDAIDGSGHRSGGTEQLTTDLEQQSRMAAECLAVAKAEQVYLTYGTPYHTTIGGEDWENLVATFVGESKYTKEVKTVSHLYLNVNGLVFDCKHKVGSAGLPHSRHTAVAKEKISNMLWADLGVAPKSDIIIRSHVHYANYCGSPRHLALTTPALQGLGSKYGARQCSGIVDFGLTVFDVSAKGEYQWQYIIPASANQLQKAHVLTA